MKEQIKPELMTCNSCGLSFDCTDLSHIVAHEHHIELILKTRTHGKKGIEHARYILPDSSREFQFGANSAFKGNYPEHLLYQDSPDFQKGYWFAKENLIDKYYLMP